MSDYPNPPEKAVRLEPQRCIDDCSITQGSAYDEFVTGFKELIMAAGEARDVLLVRLCLLGLTSLTEEYFRSALSGMARVCPKCFQKACANQISIAASRYYPRDAVGYALIEHISLSDADTIKKQTQRMCDLSIPETSSVYEALCEFDKVCHLRHAAVHSNGRLGASNAEKLGASVDSAYRIALTLDSFQEIAEICLNTVRAYNRFIWQKTIDRWMKCKVLTGKFADDKGRFMQLVALLCESAADIINDEKKLEAAYTASIDVAINE